MLLKMLFAKYQLIRLNINILTDKEPSTMLPPDFESVLFLAVTMAL